MSYILIPQIVTARTAMIWVGAIDEKVRIRRISIDYNVIGQPGAKEFVLSPSEWRTWKTRQPLETYSRTSKVQTVHFQRVTIGLDEPLIPRTKYVFKLMVDKVAEPDGAIAVHKEQGHFADYSKAPDHELPSDESHYTKATVTTLPEKLPGSGEKPFIVFLGSCFYLPNDTEGQAGRTFLNMPENEQPEIKILCGDQVYLDNPWLETTWNVSLAFSPRERMRQYFVDKYIQTWTQIKKEMLPDAGGQPRPTAVGGFNVLLRNGANYFCSDDHEFWNNAPNFGGVAFALTLLRGQRRWWFRESGDLFRIFQSLAPWMSFNVEPLSFCLADTRVNRLPKGTQFMEPDDLEAIGHWIANLKGPGVLALGQVLMAERGSFFNVLSDRSLADYHEQFKKLKDLIRASDHSIVVVTGDVHFGRVAVCDLDKAKGTKFVEVISSPMSVVSSIWGTAEFGKYKDAPDIFETGNVESIQVADQQNHFATLEFHQKQNGKIELAIKAWIISDSTNPAQSQKIKTIELS